MVSWYGKLASPAKEPEKPAPGAAKARMVEALLREREGYILRGLDERITQVDEQLAVHGYRPGKGVNKQ